jgi:hypothetical protein
VRGPLPTHDPKLLYLLIGIEVAIVLATMLAGAPPVLGMAIAAVVLIGGIILIRRRNARILRRMAIAAGRCPNCGYDIHATPDRCPECGTPQRGERV